MTQGKPEGFNNEINLYDFLEVLIKRKIFILVTVLLMAGLAAIYSFTQVPIYRTTGMIELGKFGLLPARTSGGHAAVFNFSIIEPESIIPNVNGKYGVTVSSRGNSTLVFSKEGENPDTTTESVKKLIQEFFRGHEAYFKKLHFNMTKYLNEIEKQLLAITKNQARLDRLIRIYKEQNLLPVLTEMRENDAHKAELLKDQIEFSYILGNTYSPKVMQATVSQNPVRPNKVLVILLAMVLGLILAIVLVLCLEFYVNFNAWRKSR